VESLFTAVDTQEINGFGRDDEECLFPAQPASTNQQPEKLIEQIQLWAWMTPLEHDKLLTKRQIFEKKAVMRAKEPKQCSKQSLPKRNMRESYNRALVETIAAMLLIPKSAGVLANGSGESRVTERSATRVGRGRQPAKMVRKRKETR
jgi:hypothetical protein